MKTELKICVAGMGAVGGMVSGMLGKKYAENLTVIARGKRAEAFRENGIVLNSECYGKQVVRPAHIVENGEQLPVQDIVFICVKNYSLEQIAASLKSCVGSETIVVPVMNGVEPGEKLRELFPDAIVCDALIYTVSSAEPDYSVKQLGKYTYMYIGSREKDDIHARSVKQLYELFKAVDFDIRMAENIESEIWQKYILNCAFNTITARFLCNSSDIRNSEQLKSDARALLTESYLVGCACGVKLPVDLVETKYQFMMKNQAENATSSMRRDVEAKRPTELEAFLGYVVRKAAVHEINTPISKRYYRELLEIEKQ